MRLSQRRAIRQDRRDVARPPFLSGKTASKPPEWRLLSRGSGLKCERAENTNVTCTISALSETVVTLPLSESWSALKRPQAPRRATPLGDEVFAAVLGDGDGVLVSDT